MRFFAVLIALLAFTFSARLHAQTDAPPAPLDAPPVANDAAPDGEPAPPIEAAPAPPIEAAPAPLAPDAAAPTTPAPDAPKADGCGSWPLALSGAMFEGGALGVGGLMFCIGGALATMQPTSSSDNCAQACVDLLVALAIIAIGIVIVAGALVVLGPIASIAVTTAMALAAVGAGRAWWPAAVGGALGIVTAVAGIGLVSWGFVNAQTQPFIAGEPLTLADPPHAALVGGMILTAASGLVSLGAGLALDALVGGPVENRGDEQVEGTARAAPQAPRLTRPRTSAVRAAMAY